MLVRHDDPSGLMPAERGACAIGSTIGIRR